MALTLIEGDVFAILGWGCYDGAKVGKKISLKKNILKKNVNENQIATLSFFYLVHTKLIPSSLMVIIRRL